MMAINWLINLKKGLTKSSNKIGDGDKLEKYSLDKLPKFLQDNLNIYKDWMD